MYSSLRWDNPESLTVQVPQCSSMSTNSSVPSTGQSTCSLVLNHWALVLSGLDEPSTIFFLSFFLFGGKLLIYPPKDLWIQSHLIQIPRANGLLWPVLPLPGLYRYGGFPSLCVCAH